VSRLSDLEGGDSFLGILLVGGPGEKGGCTICSFILVGDVPLVDPYRRLHQSFDV
jgi:hypothetical protein